MENPTLMTEIRANLQQMMENDLQLQQQAAEQAEQQQADQSEGDEPE